MENGAVIFHLNGSVCDGETEDHEGAGGLVEMLHRETSSLLALASGSPNDISHARRAMEVEIEHALRGLTQTLQKRFANQRSLAASELHELRLNDFVEEERRKTALVEHQLRELNQRNAEVQAALEAAQEKRNRGEKELSKKKQTLAGGEKKKEIPPKEKQELNEEEKREAEDESSADTEETQLPIENSLMSALEEERNALQKQVENLKKQMRNSKRVVEVHASQDKHMMENSIQKNSESLEQLKKTNKELMAALRLSQDSLKSQTREMENSREINAKLAQTLKESSDASRVNEAKLARVGPAFRKLLAEHKHVRHELEIEKERSRCSMSMDLNMSESIRQKETAASMLDELLISLDMERAELRQLLAKTRSKV